MNNIHVFKFGGASIKDADGIRNLGKILDLNKDKQLLIVVSAIDKTTNKLKELTQLYLNRRPETEQALFLIKQFHENILTRLFMDALHPVFDTIANTFVEIEWILEEEPHTDHAFVYDQIVSIGELASTRIVSAYLNHIGFNNAWTDARNYIHTDNTYQEGKVDWEKTRNSVQKDLPAILQNQYIVTQGFIGGTSENYTTTLGREGSDYSAAIFATSLNAQLVTIWKDVPGVLNADPKLFPDTEKYDELSYTEALEMTYYGAQVIHPKTIKPLQNADIPLIVKPFKTPHEKGTVISSSAPTTKYIPAIIIKDNQVLVSISTTDLSFISELHLSDIFKLFAKHRKKINMMQLSAISFTICLDWEEISCQKIFAELKATYAVKYNTGLRLVTIRNYKREIIERMTSDSVLLLKQLSRSTAQLILK